MTSHDWVGRGSFRKTLTESYCYIHECTKCGQRVSQYSPWNPSDEFLRSQDVDPDCDLQLARKVLVE